jgi:hypothetical protein
MSAYSKWTISTQIKFKDPIDALKIFIRDIDFVHTPGPDLWIMKGRGDKYKAYNDDYGLIIDDEHFDDFEISEWEKYLSSALSNPDWHSRVRGGTELNISFAELAKMVQLSIDLGVMPSPFMSDDNDKDCRKIDIRGNADDAMSPYSFKIGDLSELVAEDHNYCVISVGAPSNDGGACYLKTYIGLGKLLLKRYEFQFSTIIASSNPKELNSIFAKIKSPEFYLAEYNKNGSIQSLDEIQMMVEGWQT